MARPKLPLEGGCRCGEVRIRISAPPLLTMACHCTGCQRMTGGPYSLSVAIPAEGFEIIRGEPTLGGLRTELQHYCCPSCLSWMFTKMPGMDWFVNVRATMLDDVSWFTPFVETMTSEMLPWAQTPAPHSFPKFPPMEAFGDLTAEFAALPD